MEPTSSKGKSPWKVKMAKGTRDGGIVIPKSAILVNQGLGKIKIEEDFVEQKPDVCLPEENVNSIASSTDVVSTGEAVTEEHLVIKVEADILMSSEGAPASNDEHGMGSLSSCGEKLEALECTVVQLTLQLEKQNEAMKKQDEVIMKQQEEIAGMKLSMRNFGLSMTTDDEDKTPRSHASNGHHKSLGKNSCAADDSRCWMEKMPTAIKTLLPCLVRKLVKMNLIPSRLARIIAKTAIEEMHSSGEDFQ